MTHFFLTNVGIRFVEAQPLQVAGRDLNTTKAESSSAMISPRQKPHPGASFHTNRRALRIWTNPIKASCLLLAGDWGSKYGGSCDIVRNVSYKYETTAPASLLEPLSIPKWVQGIAMNFIPTLPNGSGKTVIMAVFQTCSFHHSFSSLFG